MIKIDGDMVAFKGSENELLSDFVKLHLAIANNKKLMQIDLDSIKATDEMVHEKDSYIMHTVDVGEILKKLFDEEK